MTKSNESLSLPKKKIIHGVEVRKMPCGKYFETLQTLKNLPEDFIKKLTEGKEEFRISEMLTIEGMTELSIKFLTILPDFTVSFLATLIDIEEEKIKNELSPKELVDIIQEFWEMNELESFFEKMKSMLDKFSTLVGFKKQLPSASKSELIKEISSKITT